MLTSFFGRLLRKLLEYGLGYLHLWSYKIGFLILGKYYLNKYLNFHI